MAAKHKNIRRANSMKRGGAHGKKARREPYRWLGAGVVGVGVALANGTGIALADDSGSDRTSPSDSGEGSSTVESNSSSALGSLGDGDSSSPAGISASSSSREPSPGGASFADSPSDEDASLSASSLDSDLASLDLDLDLGVASVGGGDFEDGGTLIGESPDEIGSESSADLVVTSKAMVTGLASGDATVSAESALAVDADDAVVESGADGDDEVPLVAESTRGGSRGSGSSAVSWAPAQSIYVEELSAAATVEEVGDSFETLDAVNVEVTTDSSTVTSLVVPVAARSDAGSVAVPEVDTSTGLPSSAVMQFLSAGDGPIADQSPPVPAPFNPLGDFLFAVFRQVRTTFFNSSPTAHPRQDETRGDGRATGTLGASDPDGDPLTYAVIEGPTRGQVTLNADGSYLYAASEELAAAGGSDTFTVLIAEANADSHIHGFGGLGARVLAALLPKADINDGSTIQTTVTVAIEQVNQAPEFEHAKAGAAGSVYDSATSTASDEPAVVISQVKRVIGAASTSTASLAATAFTSSGDDLPYVSANAVGTPSARTALSTAVAANEAPTGVVDSFEVVQDLPRTFTAAELVGNDIDPDGDTLAVHKVGGSAGGAAVLNADGSVTFTPEAGFTGAAKFYYRPEDSVGAVSANAPKVSLTVRTNEAPTGVVDSFEVVQDLPRTFTAAELVGNDIDPDGDTLAVHKVGGSAGGAAVLNADGSVTFTPEAGFTGAAKFYYRPEDSVGAVSANAPKVSLTVRTNEAPTGVVDSFEMVQDLPRTFTAAELVGNDIDPDGDTLAVHKVGGSAGGAAVLNADGSVTFTPEAGFTGAAKFYYRPEDSVGAVSANAPKVSLTVAANEAPTGVVDSFEVVQDLPRTFTAAELVGNDIDPDGDTLAVHKVGGSAGGAAVLNADGSVTFTPEAGFTGAAKFYYRPEDSVGAVSANAPKVSLTVRTNEAPTGVVDSFEVVQDLPRTFTAAELVGNDIDPDGDTLAVHKVGGSAGGAAVLNADGSVTFTPEAGFTGAAKFYYRPEDSVGAVSANAPKVSLTVRTNEAPTGVVDSFEVVQDLPRTFTAAELVGNDIDPDGDTLAVHKVGGSAGGAAVLNADGSVTFTPEAGFTGAAKFYYRPEDSVGAVSANAPKVSLTVRTNEAPTGVVDSFEMVQDLPRTFTAAELVGNDIDPDGDTLAVHKVGGSAGGAAVLNADGSVTFTPEAGFTGAAKFYYRPEDSVGAVSANAPKVSLTVNANEAPQVGTPAFEIIDVDPTTGVVSGSVYVSDPDGDSLSYSLNTFVDPAVGAVAVDTTTGAWTYTPTLTALLRPAWGVDGYDTLTFNVDAYDGKTSIPVVVNAPVGVSTDALLDIIELEHGSEARAIFAIALSLGLPGLLGD